MGRNPSDTRNAQRKPIRVFINYRTIDQFFSEIGTNLSTGGVFIRSTNPLPVGSEIKISFNIPQFGCYLESMGVVVHNGTAENPGMGIKFRNLSERAKSLLNDVLEHELLPATSESPTSKSESSQNNKKKRVETKITVSVESRVSTRDKRGVGRKKITTRKGPLSKGKKSATN